MSSSSSASSSFNPLHHVHGKGEVAFDLMDKTVFIPPSSDDIRNQHEASWEALYYTAEEYARIKDDNQKYIDSMNCTYDQPLYCYDPLPVNHPHSGGTGSAVTTSTRTTQKEEECCCFRGLEHMTMRGSRRRKMDIQRAIYAVLEEQDRQRRSCSTEDKKHEGTINPELLAEIYRGFTTINESDARRLAKKDEAAVKEECKHERESSPEGSAVPQMLEHPLCEVLMLVQKETDSLSSSSASKLSFVTTSSGVSDTKGGAVVSSDSNQDEKAPPTSTSRRSSSSSTSRRRRPLFGFFQRNSARSKAR